MLALTQARGGISLGTKPIHLVVLLHTEYVVSRLFFGWGNLHKAPPRGCLTCTWHYRPRPELLEDERRMLSMLEPCENKFGDGMLPTRAERHVLAEILRGPGLARHASIRTILLLVPALGLQPTTAFKRPTTRAQAIARLRSATS